MSQTFRVERLSPGWDAGADPTGEPVPRVSHSRFQAIPNFEAGDPNSETTSKHDGNNSRNYNHPGGTEVQATYINQVDLNLTRNHDSIAYPSSVAAYVCNHLGSKDETRAEVDRVVEDAVAGKNLVACAAMDYIVHPGANADNPLVRFMIFGPDGSLLPSVNLDNHGEKSVPDVCVAGHGGDR
jgi:hypothetical protein